MTKPLLNQSSEKKLLATSNNLPQSLFLTGEVGIGLTTIAKYIASLQQTTPIIILPEKDEKVDIEKGVIGVEIIRRLYNDTRTKSTGKQIIIIDYAERMTIQAQNAFLKLLEEPGDNVHFILLSHSPSKMLPTILSRTENISIDLITGEQSALLLDQFGVTDKVKRSQLIFMAIGLPAELTRLCNDETYFSIQVGVVRDARELLRGSTYQKLLIAQKYKDNRALALVMLSDTLRILKQSITSNPQIETVNRIDAILNAYQQIEANGNIRLCLARMVI